MQFKLGIAQYTASRLRRLRAGLPAGAVLLLLAATAATGCGDDDDGGSGSGSEAGATDEGGGGTQATGGGNDGAVSESGAGGAASGNELVDFYEPQSMLYRARQQTAMVAGDQQQWNGQYMNPEPEMMKEQAGEFLTIYPRAILPATGQSVLGTLADDELWSALEQIGITLMHPVAIEQAGQLVGRDIRPSVDGGFDRISFDIEPGMGTEDDVHRLVRVAEDHGAVLAGDIVPLHTGRGFDFRLALMNYQDYPGMYDMLEIPEEYWDLLPAVEEEGGYAILKKDQAQPLIDEGLIPGMFDVLLGKESSTDWSGWAATEEIEGVDGKKRRWVYSHLFKPEQPALNWMDPSYAARLSQTGDVVRHVVGLGMRVDRLDAVPFLALQPKADSDQIDVFTNPLAIMGTNDLSFTHRKLGAWTWVELNVPVAEYARYMENGPDIGYDFFTRAQTVHPLINGDARILRVAQRTVLESKVDQGRLIHALQNHDEIAYQLINLRAQGMVEYGDEAISGSELADRILQQAQEAAAGDSAPYNALYRPSQNGIASTYASFIAPALGIDPYDASDDEVETIKRAHVLLAHVSAMQPGIFALSQWDLVGALPLERSQVKERIAEGDFRWLNRGSVDLMGVSDATDSPFELPEAERLYPPLGEQLDDPSSFASQVGAIIAARKRFRIASATVNAVPDLDADAGFALVMSLASDVGGVGVTAANYSQDSIEVTLDLADVPGSEQLDGNFPYDIVAEEEAGTLSGTMLTVSLDPLSARTLVIGAQAQD